LGELLRPESPFLLLHVYGPGGVGKTTLLGEFAALALEHGFSPLPLDARDLDPSPEGFLLALRAHLGLGADASPLQHLAQQRPTLLL
ncbi:ATP-binding protein, partial [Escherichia coli]|nr:ATP-binding protein [Escherichia coli]